MTSHNRRYLRRMVMFQFSYGWWINQECITAVWWQTIFRGQVSCIVCAYVVVDAFNCNLFCWWIKILLVCHCATFLQCAYSIGVCIVVGSRISFCVVAPFFGIWRIQLQFVLLLIRSFIARFFSSAHMQMQSACWVTGVLCLFLFVWWRTIRREGPIKLYWKFGGDVQLEHCKSI